MRRVVPLLLPLLVSCTARGIPADIPPAQPPDGRITAPELQALVVGFADRAMESTVAATQRLIDLDPSPAMRRSCSFARLYVSSLACSCAVQKNPEVALLDMIVGISVQRFVVDGPRGDALFPGDAAREIRAHMQALEEEAWRLGARALGEEQRRDLEALIAQWKREHGDATYVGFVRFEDFAAAREKSSLSGVERRGVLRLLAPIDETNRQIEETRLFAERALFLAQRAPFLARWQAEVFAYEMLDAPDVRRTIDALELSAAAADSLAKSAEGLPATIAAERERLLDALDAREGSLKDLVAESRRTIADARALAGDAKELGASGERLAASVREASEAFGRTVEGADRLIANLRNADAPGGAASFDVEKYASAIERLTAAAQAANEALGTTERLLASPAFRERLEEADGVADRRIDEFDATARGWIDHAALRVVQLAGAILLLLLGYRFLAVRIGRGGAR